MNQILINIPYVIETPRLKLQVPQAGFGEQLHAAIHDGYEDYVRFLNWPATPPTVEAVEEEARRNHAEFILREFIRYMIIDKTTNTVIGRCAYPPLQSNWAIPQFGLAYFVRKNARAKGYASEAALAIAKLAFRLLKAKKLEIYCEVENKASTALARKIGFELEYTQRGSWLRPDGQLATLQTYSAFSEAQIGELEVHW